MLGRAAMSCTPSHTRRCNYDTKTLWKAASLGAESRALDDSARSTSSCSYSE